MFYKSDPNLSIPHIKKHSKSHKIIENRSAFIPIVSVSRVCKYKFRKISKRFCHYSRNKIKDVQDSEKISPVQIFMNCRLEHVDLSKVRKTFNGSMEKINKSIKKYF